MPIESLPVSKPTEISPAEAIDDAMEIEDTIRALEQRLFGGDPGLRELETACLLPEAIHKTAVIMGEPIQRERMRGHLTWAAWLKGRLYTREHGLQPLTPDLIVDLHRHTMDEIHESDPGVFRKNQETSGSSFNTDGKLRPFTLNDEQLGVINDNPLLDFEPKLPDYPEYYDLGYVRHTVLPEQIGEVLQAICDEYNQGYLDGKDPHQLAAKLQQDITFLKPFAKGNDLISSLLMNWSLENAGYTPSASLPIGKDVFASEEKWAETVRSRSRDTFNMLQHIETGEVNPAVLLGVTHEQSRYATGEPQYTSATPQLVQRLEPGSYFRYLTFLDQLNKPRSIGHPSQSAPSNWEDEVLQIQYFQNYQREVAKYKHLPKASKPAPQSIRIYPRTEGIFGILRQQVGRDFVLHGSAQLNIPELEPRTTQNLHVHHATGELIDPNKAVFATTDPTLAIFYATVFAPVRQTGLRRNVGVKGVTDTNGITIGYLYFASNPAKEIVRKCLLAGKPSSVYHIERKGCHYYSDSAEWVRHSSARVCGYLAVTALSLPFDVFGLPHPLSDPDIRAFVEKFG